MRNYDLIAVEMYGDVVMLIIENGQYHGLTQGYRVWKSGRKDSEHSENRLALSSPSSSGFDDFRSHSAETNPNAIPLAHWSGGGSRVKARNS